MQFRIGDKVIITPRRDVNVPPVFSDQLSRGDIGSITRISLEDAAGKVLRWHGPYEVTTLDGCMHYCLEEEIMHLDGPQIPYDQVRELPIDKWMRIRRWVRAVRS